MMCTQSYVGITIKHIRMRTYLQHRGFRLFRLLDQKINLMNQLEYILQTRRPLIGDSNLRGFVPNHRYHPGWSSIHRPGWKAGAGNVRRHHAGDGE